MSAPFNFDPFDMWRQAVTKMEEGINTLGTQSLNSDQLSKAVLEFSTVSMQMQHAMEKVLGQYFKQINLPSRTEFLELAETVRRIEDKLDQLIPASQERPRPARTRLPPAPLTSAAAAPSAAPAAPASLPQAASRTARSRPATPAKKPPPARSAPRHPAGKGRDRKDG